MNSSICILLIIRLFELINHTQKQESFKERLFKTLSLVLNYRKQLSKSCEGYKDMRKCNEI